MVNSTPNTPTPVEYTASKGVKPATPDLIVFNNDNIPVEYMTDLLFENIGGQEILNVSRNDIVNGQNIVYTPIKNLTSLSIGYGPKNIFSLPDTAGAYFDNFAIRLDEKTPETGTGPNQEILYMETDESGLYQNLVVNVINMAKSEQVEIEVLSAGNTLGDIIY